MGISVTREGARFVLLLGIISFAAYNTKNNLLYLMLSVGIATGLVGLASGWWALRRLSVAGFEMPDAFAGQPFREKLLIRNSGRFFDAFGLRLEGEAGTLAVVRKGAVEPCWVTRLYRRRGLYAGAPVEVISRFPFGFFRLSRRLDARRELLVFPRVRPIDAAMLRARRGASSGQARRRGQGDEFFRLREYVSGDHVHHIHWKTTAKLDEIFVREFGEDPEERFCIAFPSVLEGDREASEFEVMVSAVASIASHFVETGMGFRFIADDFELPPRRSREHLRRVLARLATIESRRTLSPGFVARVEAALRNEETVFVVTGEGIGASSLAGSPELRTVEPRKVLRIETRGHERPPHLDSRPLV